MPRWWAVVAFVMAMPSPSDACSCIPRTDEEHVALADVAFDGIIVADARLDFPKACTVPSERVVTPGCLEVIVWDRDACAMVESATVYVGRVGASSDERVSMNRRQDMTWPRLFACKLPAGPLEITGGLIEPTRVELDPKRGGSVTVSTIPHGKWRALVKVTRPIKGELAPEVFVENDDEASCGNDWPGVGAHMRFMLTKQDDGDYTTRGCDGSRSTHDDDVPLPRIVTPPAPPVPVATPATPSSGGCATSEPGLVLGFLVFVRRRRRR